MQNRGCAIDAVGMQAHFSISRANEPAYISGLAENLARYEEIGISVHISEFDLNDGGFDTFYKETGEWDDELQAQQDSGFVNVLRTCVEAASCDVFQFCSLTDKWGCAMREGMPWFDDYRPKPAVSLMIDAVLVRCGTAGERVERKDFFQNATVKKDRTFFRRFD